ncbi:MAG: AraC family transcriptional regulator [Bacteroidota bacterium]
MKNLDSLQLTLLNAGRVDLDHRWDYDNVISPFSRLYMVTAGEAKVYHHQRLFRLRPGFSYLIPSYTYSRYHCETSHTQYYLSFLESCGEGLSSFDLLNFEYETPALPGDQALLDRLLSLNPGRFLYNDNPEVYDNLPTLKTFQRQNLQLSPSAFAETRGILQILFARFIRSPRKAITHQANARNYIADTVRYIRLNLTQQLTVASLAERIHLNPDYFSRLFKAGVGMRPGRFIQLSRVERAQLLLQTTNYSLEKIAEKVGFSHRSYFTRQFKSFTGQTPAAYRKSRIVV